MSQAYTISTCPPELRPEALRVLHSALPSDQQASLVHVIHSANDAGEEAFRGLWVALAGDQVLAAAWIQFVAGRTAVVWLPQAGNPVVEDLLCEVAEALDREQVTLAQFLVSDELSVDDSLLEKADFQRLARLAYLAAEVGSRSRPTSSLAFENNASEDPERLGKLLRQTYELSADCPRLNGVRNLDDTIAGYREQGEFDPKYWSFIQSQGVDVGTLLLTFHADTRNWELVYMGLVPAVRGQRLGRDVLDYAFWQVSQAGANQLVLAVDEANTYAMEMYLRAGFTAWDHRTVYARLRKD